MNVSDLTQWFVLLTRVRTGGPYLEHELYRSKTVIRVPTSDGGTFQMTTQVIWGRVTPSVDKIKLSLKGHLTVFLGQTWQECTVVSFGATKMPNLTPFGPTLAPCQVIIRRRLFSVHGWYSLHLAFKRENMNNVGLLQFIRKHEPHNAWSNGDGPTNSKVSPCLTY